MAGERHAGKVEERRNGRIKEISVYVPLTSCVCLCCKTMGNVLNCEDENELCEVLLSGSIA